MTLEDSNTSNGGFSRRELWSRIWGKREDYAADRGNVDSSSSSTEVLTSRPPFIPMFRPPGAGDEATFLSKCSGCSECITACPYGVLRAAPRTRYRSVANTPVVDFRIGPCRVCPDRPCVAACRTGALQLTAQPKIGAVEIVTHECVAWQGGFCSTCTEQCPVPGAMFRQMGKPMIDAEKCWGCGVCQHVCPAPTNAVRIMPFLPTPLGV
ncbi:MAG: 4Fe-4S dicluster domain-containing protein [Myxococcales bacterium]|nr:4Fe-4S dicluster domain-containing protein [Myxococcales bacterium]